MRPWLSASLSLIPGLGHWVFGRRRKAAALFVFDGGICFTLYFLRSNTGLFLAGFSYLLIMVPAVIETHALANGGVCQLSESKLYIIALLLMKGCSALPLMWHSPFFSKRAKMIGSIIVPTVALLYWCFLAVYGIRFYNYLKIQFG